MPPIRSWLSVTAAASRTELLSCSSRSYSAGVTSALKAMRSKSSGNTRLAAARQTSRALPRLALASAESAESRTVDALSSVCSVTASRSSSGTMSRPSAAAVREPASPVWVCSEKKGSRLPCSGTTTACAASEHTAATPLRYACALPGPCDAKAPTNRSSGSLDSARVIMSDGPT